MVLVEFEWFLYLIYVLVWDLFVIDIVINGDILILNFWLVEFVQWVGLDVIYLMDIMGLIIVVFNFDIDVSFVGQNYGFWLYFQVVLSGEQGCFYVIGSMMGILGYFIVDVVIDVGGNIVGVVVIKIELFQFE